MIAELLEELRARGIELHANGATLRVVGSKGAYSAAIRARLLASKPEILEHLRRVEESAAARYDREERAWAAEYLAHLAVARGYSEELARAAATIVAKAPPRATFRIGREAIVISMGEGLEVRVHRAPEGRLEAFEGGKSECLSPREVLGATNHTLGR
ncbi:MAG: hypothetical protein ACLQVI_38125 [Polyangiaceae bacterium]